MVYTNSEGYSTMIGDVLANITIVYLFPLTLKVPIKMGTQYFQSIFLFSEEIMLDITWLRILYWQKIHM